MRYLLDKVCNVLFASGNRTPRWQFSAVSFEGLMRQLETASRKSFRTDSKQMLHFSGRCQANNCQSATTISASHPCLKADARKHQLPFVPMRSPWGSMRTSRCQCLLKQHVRHIPQWRCATPRHPRAANIAVPVRLRSKLCRLKLTTTNSSHCMSLPLCSNCVLMFHECELVSHLLHCWTSHWWYFLHFVSKKHIKLNCMLYCLKFFCLQIKCLWRVAAQHIAANCSEATKIYISYTIYPVANLLMNISGRRTCQSMSNLTKCIPCLARWDSLSLSLSLSLTQACRETRKGSSWCWQVATFSH